MKNKKLTYLLGIMVLVIWGLIIYRIVAFAGGDDEMPMPPVTNVKEPYNDYSVPKDTSHLLLNYRDPFGLLTFKDTVKSSHKPLKEVTIIHNSFNWNFIHYAGYMRNPGSKKLIAILTINGKNVNLADGETADKVKLLQNKGDSVKVKFEGRSKFISIQKN